MAGRVGLIGWPVEHSLSPAMHNAAFRALGLNWRYDLLPVPPALLEQRIVELIAEGYRGLNVTVPHKQAVLALPQIAHVDPDAAAIGAANTLTLLPGGGLRASNTDWRGFADDLVAHGIVVSGATCLVLGTGGSAKAVAYALRSMGARQIVHVSRALNGRDEVINYSNLQHAVCAAGDGLRLVVNCTPVGMHPRTDVSPWPEGVPFPARAALYDLVYNPPVTLLIQQARLAGMRAIGGLGMLVRQGALSFERWVGKTPDMEIMRRAAEDTLPIQEALENHDA
jgi:shikimate dehydrogenase